MPQGGAARKSDNSSSAKNRSSSNSIKRQKFGAPKPANNNVSTPSKTPTLRGMPKPANNNAAPASTSKPTSVSKTPTAKGMPQKAPGSTTLRGVGPTTPKIPPKPTGSASASAIKPRSPNNKSRSVGPEAIARPVNQAQMAARLNADQQQSRRDQSPGSGPTREEMLADSNDSSGGILPGQYDPLQGSSAYGKESTAPPGSMAESPKIDTERGGGQMGSDLERQRAMQLQQSKMASVQQSGGGSAVAAGLPALSGKESAQTSAEKPESSTQTSESGSKIFQMGQDNKDTGEIAKAGQLAQAVGAERTAKALQTTQNVVGNVKKAQKIVKSLKNFWNLIKAGELAAGISVVSLIVLVVTANLQMINKYTFKNKLIPDTYLVEDAAIICFDCSGCISICFNIFTVSVIISIFIGMLILIGGLYGLDYFGVLDIVGLSF